MSGSTISATPLTNGNTVSFDSSSSDNYYSFTLNSAGNVLISGSDGNGYDINIVKIYDSNFSQIDSFSVYGSNSKSLSAGTYYIQPIDSTGGSFSVTSNAMSNTPIIIIPPAEDTTSTNTSLTDIESFVARFYTEVLDRKYDESGLQNWTNHLTNNTKTVKDITMGFFKSEEFLNKNVSNSEFVTIAYNTLLGREPESQGYNSWINNLNNGLSRDNLLDGFINSAEFSNIAQSYGIDISMDKGEDSSVDNSSLTDIESFVARFYTEVLDRKYDESGLENWSSHLKNGTKTADDIANGFFFSEEFINKNINNSDFVDIAYQSLLGRNADTVGRSHWINNLDNGMSRSDMIDGFIYSDEFKNLASNYGIVVGAKNDDIMDWENQTEIFNIANIQELTLNSISNPMYAEYNTYKIPFNGTTYLEFETIYEGVFKIKHSGYGYMKPKITIYDNNKNILSDYSTLDAGKYIIEVYNDKNPDFGAYISILSPYFKGTTVYEIPDINGFNFTSPKGFSSFFELNLDKDSNTSINGHYQDIYLYDENLNDTNLNIDNRVEYIQEGEYNVLFVNHTIYSQPFELLLI